MKIPAPRAEYSLTESALSPFQAEPTQLFVALIALAMMGVFAIRMRLGISSLPLRLGGSICSESESPEAWNRMQMLIFVLVCPLFLLDRFFGTLFSIPNWTWYRLGISGFSVYIVLLDVVTPLLLILLAILILGESGRKSARSSLHLPEPRFAFFGLMLPVLIGLMIPLLQYGYDRAEWAVQDFGKIPPPQFTSYFSLGASWHWALVLMVFGAFAEEIVFRGMLLPSLFRRYGLDRGVFLTGLIWAAFHFHSDMHLRYSLAQVLLHLASRIAICLAMNYVLSWMTLRWNSVIPAAIAHTISNVLIVSVVNNSTPFPREMRVALWAVCALVLFHYWPIREVGDIQLEMRAEGPTQLPVSQGE